MAKSKKSEYQERVEKVIGKVVDWEEYKTGFRFRPPSLKSITLMQINALAHEFNTDRINFNAGYSPEPGYSELTPGIPGSAGYIQVEL